MSSNVRGASKSPDLGPWDRFEKSCGSVPFARVAAKTVSACYLWIATNGDALSPTQQNTRNVFSTVAKALDVLEVPAHVAGLLKNAFVGSWEQCVSSVFQCANSAGDVLSLSKELQPSASGDSPLASRIDQVCSVGLVYTFVPLVKKAWGKLSGEWEKRDVMGVVLAYHACSLGTAVSRVALGLFKINAYMGRSSDYWVRIFACTGTFFQFAGKTVAIVNAQVWKLDRKSDDTGVGTEDMASII